jgi:hypothetical protein
LKTLSQFVDVRDPAGPSGLRRRCLLALAACAAALPRPVRATPALAAEPFPDGVTLLVAGPAGSDADQWASLLMPALARSLPGGGTLHRILSGGRDGVTGVNQFAARTEPDGATGLLLPGAAARAWLVGDPRAHFDMGPFVPVFAALTSAVLCARPPAGGWSGRPRVRIAAASPDGPELPGLLGLDLLGAEVVPVVGVLGGGAGLSGAGARRCRVRAGPRCPAPRRRAGAPGCRAAVRGRHHR